MIVERDVECLCKSSDHCWTSKMQVLDNYVSLWKSLSNYYNLIIDSEINKIKYSN